MKTYRYQAIDSSGKTHNGLLETDSSKAVRQQLRDKGLIPVTVDAFGHEKISINAPAKKINVRDLALLTRQLATLIAAKLPIEQSILGVSEQSEKKNVKTILLNLRARVLEGHSLAHAIKQFPNAFPPLYCATIEAGEQSGKLDLVLNRLADHTEQQQVMKQKVQQALIYPAVMTTISIGIISFLLSFVVPKIIGVFHSTGQTLPQLTQTLIAISDYLKNYGLVSLIALIILGVSFKHALKNESIRFRWDHFLLRIPLLSYLIRATNTARFSHTLAILSSGGVPILSSLSVATDLLNNLPIKRAVEQAVTAIKEGASLSKALKKTTYFNPMSIHLISSGEDSGKLSQMLEHAAKTQDNDVKRIIETGLTLFEPLIILVMGAFVLFIVLATLLPIFSMDQLVH